MASPRIVKSHLPVKLLPVSFWEKNCKVTESSVLRTSPNSKNVTMNKVRSYPVSYIHLFIYFFTESIDILKMWIII